MEATAMENMKLAREAIGRNDYKAAKLYYETVHREKPGDLEAEWFYLFGVVAVDPIDGNTANHCKRLAEIFYPTLEYIATFEEGEEKHNLVLVMITVFPPLKDIMHDAMIRLLTMNPSPISTEDAAKVDLALNVDNARLANNILKIFGDSEPYCFMAANIWKQQIAERYQWSAYRNFQDRGKELWFDELAKKIKKYDPSYEMPQFKQAGCISSGDAAKVTPGK